MGQIIPFPPRDVDMVTPPFQGIESTACMAEIRAALAEYRERHGQLPWHLLAVQGRA